MRFIESNYRYNMYSAGFHYIVEFNTRRASDRDMYASMHKVLTSMYGVEKERIEPDPNVIGSFPKWVVNENWRVESRPSLKRRRIYLKDKGAYTMALLKLS